MMMLIQSIWMTVTGVSIPINGRELGVSDRVEFVGFLDRRGLRRLLDESDAMVFPTHAEGFYKLCY